MPILILYHIQKYFLSMFFSFIITLGQDVKVFEFVYMYFDNDQ